MKAYPRPFFRGLQRRPRLHWIYDISITEVSQALKSHPRGRQNQLILAYPLEASNDNLAYIGSMISPSVPGTSLTRGEGLLSYSLQASNDDLAFTGSMTSPSA